MIVMKFGGSSVKDSLSVNRVSKIIESRKDKKPVVVVSATGDTTDDLASILEELENKEKDASLIVEKIRLNHTVIIDEILKDNEMKARAIKCLKKEINRLLKLVSGMEMLGEVSIRSRDAVFSAGERIIAPILAACLTERGLESKELNPSEIIVTDDNFGCASPDFAKTSKRCREKIIPLCESGLIPVVGGFTGATENGIITTLGRGGSDFTASIIAIGIKATALEFWKDVDGILSADPRIVTDAKPAAEITFQEASELAFLGAAVLHPRSILPAVEASIPICVFNSIKPQNPGTIITQKYPIGSFFNSTFTNPKKNVVTSIAHKRNQVLVNIFSTKMLGASGFLNRVFKIFNDEGVCVDHIATSEVNITVTTGKSAKIPALESKLAKIAKVNVIQNAGVVSVVGHAISVAKGIGADVFDALKDINVMFITQGGSGVNLSVVVKNEKVDEAVKKLHKKFFN